MTPPADPERYKNHRFPGAAAYVVELPAGPLGFAAGYEYRREFGFDQPDAITASGATTGNARLPVIWQNGAVSQLPGAGAPGGEPARLPAADPGADRPDRGPARLPGERQGRLGERRDAAGADEREAVTPA